MKSFDHPWPRWPATALLIVVAVLLRVGFILAHPQEISGWGPGGGYWSTDAQQYLTLADNIVQGHGYSLWLSPPWDPDVYRSPGYPLVLAVLMKAGLSLSGILGAQITLEIISIFVAASALGKLLGNKAARWGLAFSLLCPFTAAFSGRFISESLMLPLANVLVATSLHLKTLRGVMVHGFVLGLMALTRGNLILAIPVSLVVLIAGEHFATPSSGARMPFWTRCFVLGLTAVVVLVPYGVWNHQHHGRFSLTPLAGFGRAMWSGAEQMGLPAASLPENTWEIHNSIWIERNPRPSPAELITADRQLLDAAMKRIRSAPGAYARGVVRRVIHMWAGNRYLFPGPDNPINDSLLLRAISIAITVLACLTIVTASNARLPILVAMAPAISLGISLPWMFFVMRYNSVIFGPLSLLAGAGASRLKDAMEQKGITQLLPRFGGKPTTSQQDQKWSLMGSPIKRLWSRGKSSPWK